MERRTILRWLAAAMLGLLVNPASAKRPCSAADAGRQAGRVGAPSLRPQGLCQIFQPADLSAVWRVFPELPGEWLQDAEALLRFDPLRIAALAPGDIFGLPGHGRQMARLAVVEQTERRHDKRVVRGRLLGPGSDQFELWLSLRDGRLGGACEKAGRRQALVGRHGYGWLHARPPAP